LSEYGSRAIPGNPARSSAGKLKYSTVTPPAVRLVRVPKEFNAAIHTFYRLIGSSVDRLIASVDRIGRSNRSIGSVDRIGRSVDRSIGSVDRIGRLDRPIGRCDEPINR
jgi:hypothetical protein